MSSPPLFSTLPTLPRSPQANFAPSQFSQKTKAFMRIHIGNLYLMGHWPHLPSLYLGWSTPMMLPIHEIFWCCWVHKRKGTEGSGGDWSHQQCRQSTWGAPPVKGVTRADRGAAFEFINSFQHDCLLNEMELKMWKVIGLEDTSAHSWEKGICSCGLQHSTDV